MTIGTFQNIAQVGFLLRQALVARFRAAGHDVTAEEWAVLSTLQGLPGVTVSDLAQRSLRDKTTTTRMMDGMIRKGLAERRLDPKDRRVQRLFLTRRGYEVHSEIAPLVEAVMQRAMEGTAPEAVAGVKAMLANLVADRDT